jgi:hypothetical protein
MQTNLLKVGHTKNNIFSRCVYLHNNNSMSFPHFLNWSTLEYCRIIKRAGYYFYR